MPELSSILQLIVSSCPACIPDVGASLVPKKNVSVDFPLLDANDSSEVDFNVEGTPRVRYEF